jgi:hypothetical protein
MNARDRLCSIYLSQDTYRSAWPARYQARPRSQRLAPPALWLSLHGRAASQSRGPSGKESKQLGQDSPKGAQVRQPTKHIASPSTSPSTSQPRQWTTSIVCRVAYTPPRAWPRLAVTRASKLGNSGAGCDGGVHVLSRVHRTIDGARIHPE